jgi:hypothetical protein
MGHQINFYLSPADTATVWLELRKTDSVQLLHSRSPTAQPRLLGTSDLLDNIEPWLFYFLVKSDDVNSVVMRHVPAQGYWTVDVVQSPVVELIKCFFDGQIIRRGRLYYTDKYYAPDGQLTRKSDLFVKWAKSLFATTRKCLTKQGGDYVGKDAAQWIAASSVELAQ